MGPLPLAAQGGVRLSDTNPLLGPPWWSNGQESACQRREHGFNVVREDPARHRATDPLCYNH